MVEKRQPCRTMRLRSGSGNGPHDNLASRVLQPHRSWKQNISVSTILSYRQLYSEHLDQPIRSHIHYTDNISYQTCQMYGLDSTLHHKTFIFHWRRFPIQHLNIRHRFKIRLHKGPFYSGRSKSPHETGRKIRFSRLVNRAQIPRGLYMRDGGSTRALIKQFNIDTRVMI